MEVGSYLGGLVFFVSPFSVEKTEFLLPPSRKKVVANYDKFGIPGERHKKVFYSDLKDVPEKIPEVGGRVIQVEHRQEGKRILFLKIFMLIVTKINIKKIK